jgi:outer membrane protein insertion porin family
MNTTIKFHQLKLTAAAAALFLSATTSWAVTPFELKDIRIEGLQRVEPGAVFASLPFKVGEVYDDDKGSIAIRSLFSLGLFKDVRIDVSGSVAVIIVEERAHVADVNFSGVKEFDADTLKKALRDFGLAEGRPFDKSVLDRAEQELKRQYIGKSLYAVEVVSTVTPIERNRVNLTFTVKEGEPAKIKSIDIVGNSVFSASTLKGLFELDSGGWLSWYTKNDRYSRAKFNGDLESLRSYYLTRGYLEFKIDSTQVAISPDKQDINLTINISEGARFVVAGVKLEGNYLGKNNEFSSLVSVVPGQAYNSELVSQTTKAFTEQFSTYGYAFARIQVKPEIDRVNNRVTLVFSANPERRAYIRKVVITGNSKTRDEVVRREFRQLEASWYDGARIKLSKERVERLGYFKEVTLDTQEVNGTPDQVDLLVAVTEKPTGNLSLGAGFSSSEKLSLTFGIKQENIFGSGNYLGLDISSSKYNKTFVISTTDPYFTKDGVSRTLDFYTKTNKPLATQGGQYSLATHGAGIRFGVPFSELDTVFFGLSVERLGVTSGTNIPAAYLAYAQQFGKNSNSFPASVGWARDSRDSALVPTRGRYQRLGGDVAFIGDVKYARFTYQIQQYIPLNKQFTLGLSGDIGLGKGLAGNPYPVFKNFYGGGLGSLRGFDQGTLGPRDVTGAYIGGAKKIIFNAELTAPFPGAGNDKTLRLFGFVDAGNVYGEHEKLDLGNLRASSGVGISWISPMGPLRLAWAKPLRLESGDKISKIQFQIGSAF